MGNIQKVYGPVLVSRKTKENKFIPTEEIPEAAATLFRDDHAVSLEDAFWLEVKVVAQFTEEGANARYSSQLLSTVQDDIAKLSRDRGILHAGLLIVLFTANAEIADHDLGIWQDSFICSVYGRQAEAFSANLLSKEYLRLHCRPRLFARCW